MGITKGWSELILRVKDAGIVAVLCNGADVASILISNTNTENVDDLMMCSGRVSSCSFYSTSCCSF